MRISTAEPLARDSRPTLNSPSRPNFLPISEPIPVPTQRAAFERMYSQRASNKAGEEQQPAESPIESPEVKLLLIIF